MTFKSLKKDEIIDVISPATACTLDEIAQIKNFLKKSNLTPNIFLEKETTLKKPQSHEFPSFAAAMRFEQFKKAAQNPDSNLIWCTRGGYGSAEILPFLEKMTKPKKPKILIGFSDISSLNKILVEKWGWQVVSAPMLAQIVLKKVSPKAVKAILDLVFGRLNELKFQLKSLNNVKTPTAASHVVGGCISVLSGQFGTKNQINWDGKILFLEDEGEDGERLDRYFSQIVCVFVEQKKYPSAIVLGNFLQTNPHGTPKAKNIKMAIERFAQNLADKNLKIPLFEEKSKCLGHSKDMLPLVLGLETKIMASGVLVQKIS